MKTKLMALVVLALLIPTGCVYAWYDNDSTDRLNGNQSKVFSGGYINAANQYYKGAADRINHPKSWLENFVDNMKKKPEKINEPISIKAQAAPKMKTSAKEIKSNPSPAKEPEAVSQKIDVPAPAKKIDNDPVVTARTYYGNSGRLSSVTLASPDASGVISYHYLDEDWNGQGYGRVNEIVKPVAPGLNTANMDNKGFTFGFNTSTAEAQELLANHREDYFYVDANGTITMWNDPHWVSGPNYGYRGASISKTIDIKSGGETLSFSWSRSGDGNYLRLYIDGKYVDIGCKGFVLGGSTSVYLSAGNHTIRWVTDGSYNRSMVGYARIGNLLITKTVKDMESKG